MFTTTMPYFPPEDIPNILEKVRSVLENKEMLTMGNHVRQFESEFSDYIGTKYAIATNSCTSALEATLKAINVKNCEVIVPTQTFIATGASVITAGGNVIFADINTYDYNISLSSIKEKLTSRTKAVIIVHYGGLINKEIWKIKEFCKENNIYLIEDCAHAPGASINNIKAGNIGDAACFSFYATKIMTTGEGGMVTTNDENLFEIISSTRNRGIDLTSDSEIFSRVGSNFRMAEINAILGLSQLSHLDDFIAYRNKIAQIYYESFGPLEQKNLIEFIGCPETIFNSYWRYSLKLNSKIDRLTLQKNLLEKNIKIDWPYDPPLHLQPVFKKMYGNTEGMLPIAETEMKRQICLPIHVGISIEDAHYISNTILKEISDIKR